jgi:hypothetical protein
MACAHIEGAWRTPTLLSDTGQVLEDPVLVITPNGSGGFRGRFVATGEQEFDVRCTQQSIHSEVTFTRIHPDRRTTTEYTAIHLRIRPRRSVDVLVGRFRRTTSDGSAALLAGDWETEKPT